MNEMIRNIQNDNSKGKNLRSANYRKHFSDYEFIGDFKGKK
jgi:hypothetical protein